MANKVYKTWRDFPLGDWRWPNFSPQEMASKGECGRYYATDRTSAA